MDKHHLLFTIGQFGVLLQILGSLLLLRLAFTVKKFGGPELALLAMGYEDQVSMEAVGPVVFALTREMKAQFSRQLPGFTFLFLGMVCQFIGNFVAL